MLNLEEIKFAVALTKNVIGQDRNRQIFIHVAFGNVIPQFQGGRIDGRFIGFANGAKRWRRIFLFLETGSTVDIDADSGGIGILTTCISNFVDEVVLATKVFIWDIENVFSVEADAAILLFNVRTRGTWLVRRDL